MGSALLMLFPSATLSLHQQQRRERNLFTLNIDDPTLSVAEKIIDAHSKLQYSPPLPPPPPSLLIWYLTALNLPLSATFSLFACAI